MTPIPRDKSPDATLALLRDGYRFVSNRCRRYGSDAFHTRLMLSRVTCASGGEAARMFYHPGRFTRDGAMPPTALKLLQDRGSVAVLDGAAHRSRKHMFLALLSDGNVRRLTETVVRRWRERVAAWGAAGRVVLHDEVEGVLCRAVCEWAGVPLTEPEAAARTREFAAMIDGAGAVGPRNWRGLFRRRRTERWARGVIGAVRSGAARAPDGTAAHIVASHRDPDGNPLAPDVAAVELINVLRPTVAVARYVTFAALALHRYPACRERVRAGGDEYLGWFAQEVRRFYPFFPFVGGRALEPFEWRGHRFDKGAWVLFDLYGTNHDPRLWADPEEFRPERFAREGAGAFDLVAQGGGDYATGHRCPGEALTVEIVKAAVRLLADEMSYAVPEQDLGVDLSRMPAIPASRFVIADVRPAAVNRTVAAPPARAP